MLPLLAMAVCAAEPASAVRSAQSDGGVPRVVCSAIEDEQGNVVRRCGHLSVPPPPPPPDDSRVAAAPAPQVTVAPEPEPPAPAPVRPSPLAPGAPLATPPPPPTTGPDAIDLSDPDDADQVDGADEAEQVAEPEHTLVDDPLGPAERPRRRGEPRSSELPDEDLAEHFSSGGHSAAGGQWGVVTLAAAAVNVEVQPAAETLTGDSGRPPVTVGSVMLGIGPRFGLKPRSSSQMFMPAVSAVVGTAVDVRISDGVSASLLRPFAEVRGELMSVKPEGPLQPNFTAYATMGASLVGLNSAWGARVQPHVGFGLGWNWMPHFSGGGGGGWGGGFSGLGGGGGEGVLIVLGVVVAVAVVAAVIFAMVVAGRIEVRYTTPALGGGPASGGAGFFSVMLGVGC